MSYTTHADIGGRMLPGAIVNEREGEYFHAAWEPRVLGMVLAMGATGAWNLDMSRSARETLPHYARLTYYEIWFEALLKLLAEQDLVADDELSAGRSLYRPRRLPKMLAAADVPAVLARGTPTERAASQPARFAVGDRVRAYAGEVPHHTRLPSYVRGKRGTIDRVHGVHVFADANASGRGEQPHWLYTVVFDGAELWPGEARADALKVSVDAWEPYLSPV